jgi:putative Mn2+ efflux pump MntP
MPTKRAFRFLLVAEVLLAIIGSIVAVFTESQLPEALQAYEQAEAEAEFTTREWVLLGVGVVFLVPFLVSRIGLFAFWRPARRLYFWTAIGGVTLAPFFGPYVDAGWGQLFNEVAMIISGVILALIYYSPLREFYEEPKTTA